MAARQKPQKDRSAEEKVATKRKIDYVVARLDEYPKYVAKWTNASWFAEVRADPSFYSFLNHKSLPKEFAESYEAYKQVKTCLKKTKEGETTPKLKYVLDAALLAPEPGSPLPKDVLFVDMCSGKGFLSVLLNFQFPGAQILMIDNMGKINLEHINNLPRVEFWMTDIKEERFIADLKLFCKDFKAVVFIGIHLCGELSEYFLKAFHSTPNSVAMVLCPCCISKKNTELLERAKRESVSNYELWSQELLNMIEPADKELKKLTDCASEKNNFLLACK